MADSTSFRRLTRSQENKNFEKTFEAEESDDDHVMDSSDDKFFPSNEPVASDCDDTDDEIAPNNEDEDEESEDGEDEDEDEDEEEESNIEATLSGLKAKDGTKWAATPPSEHQAERRNIVRERYRANRNTNLLPNLDTFKLFFTPEMADIVIRHTNEKEFLNESGD